MKKIVKDGFKHGYLKSPIRKKNDNAEFAWIKFHLQTKKKKSKFSKFYYSMKSWKLILLVHNNSLRMIRL